VNPTLLAPIAITGFTVAFLHAALPTHWLPFVLVGRGQHWSASKTLGVTFLAGLGHVAFTILLGLVLVGAGLAVEPKMGDLFGWVVGALMIGLGLFYLWRGRHDHGEAGIQTRRYASDRAAIIALVVLLTLSPCEAFLPIYLAGVKHGWTGFAALSAVLMAATAGGMLLFTTLSLAGVKRLGLERIARYESTILGVALIAMGVGVAFLEL
jgi:cadmium resistance protein CadD (predicted permease)